MRRIVKTTLFVVAAVSAAYGSIKAYETYNSYCINDSLLMYANVEALTQDGDNMSNLMCSGPAVYAISGVINGKAALRIHYLDSIDMLKTQTFKACIATGFGNLSGNNTGVWDIDTKDDGFAKCEPTKHKNSFDEDLW